MVTLDFHQKLLRNLDMYLLKEKEFSLDGIGYELLLFIPTNYDEFDGKNSLVISAKALDSKRERVALQELFTLLGKALSFEEYSLVSTISVVPTDSELVRKLNFAFPFQQRADVDYSLNTTAFGEGLQNARLVRTSVLANLVQGKMCSVELNDGRELTGKVFGIDQEYQLTLENPDGEKRTDSCSFGDIVAVHGLHGRIRFTTAD